MRILLSSNHHPLMLKEKVQQACKNFLHTFGFSYFQYLRCYADGSVGLLTNNSGILEFFQQMDKSPVVFSSFEKEHENAASYWFLWDEALPKLPVQMVREKLHIYNGLTLVRRYKNHYDMIAVALPKEQAYPASFYLNKLKAIEQFIFEFDTQQKDLIDLMDKNPIALPAANSDVNYDKICLSQGKISVTGKFGNTHITAQELACLRLVCQNISYKKIAQLLEISPRTVETYVQRVKYRTGYSTRAEIAQIIAV